MTYYVNPDLKPGQLVTVTRPATREDWGNDWDPPMNRAVGQLCQISHDETAMRSSMGVWVYYRNGEGVVVRHAFPHAVLEPVSQEPVNHDQWRALTGGQP